MTHPRDRGKVKLARPGVQTHSFQPPQAQTMAVVQASCRQLTGETR